MRALQPGDPERLGGHTLLGRLGEGGQGTVFLGRGTYGEVAVKLLHAQLSDDPTARERFAREAGTLRRIAGFCTARVHAADLEGDRPYIISEYVPGPSLHELVRTEGPRADGALMRLAVGTATALTAIHGAGVVHRDFKPANVLMAPDGPRVIDFGIARALDHAGLRTITGQLVGTPAYMAPEQFSAAPVGPASDLFSWAQTLVFAATGRGAFGTGSMAVLIHAIRTAEPDLTGLPPELLTPLSSCLAKDPADRPTADRLLWSLLTLTPNAPPRRPPDRPALHEDPGEPPQNDRALSQDEPHDAPTPGTRADRGPRPATGPSAPPSEHAGAGAYGHPPENASLSPADVDPLPGTPEKAAQGGTRPGTHSDEPHGTNPPPETDAPSDTPPPTADSDRPHPDTPTPSEPPAEDRPTTPPNQATPPHAHPNDIAPAAAHTRTDQGPQAGPPGAPPTAAPQNGAPPPHTDPDAEAEPHPQADSTTGDHINGEPPHSDGNAWSGRQNGTPGHDHGNALFGGAGDAHFGGRARDGAREGGAGGDRGDALFGGAGDARSRGEVRGGVWENRAGAEDVTADLVGGRDPSAVRPVGAVRRGRPPIPVSAEDVTRDFGAAVPLHRRPVPDATDTAQADTAQAYTERAPLRRSWALVLALFLVTAVSLIDMASLTVAAGGPVAETRQQWTLVLATAYTSLAVITLFGVAAAWRGYRSGVWTIIGVRLIRIGLWISTLGQVPPHPTTTALQTLSPLLIITLLLLALHLGRTPRPTP